MKGRWTSHMGVSEFLPYLPHFLTDLVAIRYVRASLDAVDSLRVSWKSLHRRLCFTKRRKWSFARICHILRPRWIEFGMGDVHNDIGWFWVSWKSAQWRPHLQHFSSHHKNQTNKIHYVCRKAHNFDVEYIYGFVRWGVCRQSRWRHSVPSRPRWRICVTMATLWQQQDGGYMLLWKRYGNNKMAVMRYYGSVFYIFNSTVIDWTCCRCILHLQQYSHRLNFNFFAK